MKCSVIDGGLTAPDIFSLNRTLKFKKWLRSLHNINHPISIIQDRTLFESGVKDKFPQEIHKSIIQNISCKFYRLALETNNLISNINYKQLYLSYSRDEVDSDQLTFIAAHPLLSSVYLHNNPNKQQILRRTSIMGVTNLGSLLTLHCDNPQSLAWLQIVQCLRSFPKLWIDLLTERDDWQLNSFTNETINIGNSIWTKGQFVTTRQLRTLLSQQHTTPVDKIDIIQKYSLTLDPDDLDSSPDNPFSIKILSSPFLQTLHYKILHKAYTTRAKLCHYGKLESAICPFCEDCEDALDHALYKCELSKHTWANFQRLIDKYNIPFKIQTANIIMGVNEKIMFGPLLNTILLLIKRILVSPAESRRALSVQEIENIIKDQLQVEKAQINAIVKKRKSSRLCKFKKRWSYLLHMIE